MRARAAGDCCGQRLEASWHVRIFNFGVSALARKSFCLAFVFLFACSAGPRGPVEVTCKAIGLESLIDFSTRVEIDSFSILPPKGDYWCSPVRTHPKQIIFNKITLGGRLISALPPLSELSHTYFAAFVLASVPAELSPRDADLAKIVEGWLRGGQGVDIDRNEVKLRIPAPDRFVSKQAEVSPLESGVVECVGYRSRVEERDNPQVPGQTLDIVDIGRACRSRANLEVVVLLVASERFLTASPPSPSLHDSLRSEIDPFLGSLSLSGSRPGVQSSR